MVISCKMCGIEIDKNLKQCIHCGSDLRNFFGKHKIITSILAIAIIGGMGSTMVTVTEIKPHN